MPDICFEKFTTHKNNYDKLSHKFSNANFLAIEQNNDIILEQLKLKLLKEEYSEPILLQDNRYQLYSRQFDRLSIIDNILARQNSDETGSVKHNQILLPKHLVNELLVSLHGKANKHPGFQKCSLKLDKSNNALAYQNSSKNGLNM